jgi:hypothetical protein
MTAGLHNLSKILDKYESQLGYNTADQFELLKRLALYNWLSGTVNHAKLAQTDFNHAIGLPQKNGQL